MISWILIKILVILKGKLISLFAILTSVWMSYTSQNYRLNFVKRQINLVGHMLAR